MNVQKFSTSRVSLQKPTQGTITVNASLCLISCCLHYLHQGRYVFGCVCLLVCLFVYLLATLVKKLWTDCSEILWGHKGTSDEILLAIQTMIRMVEVWALRMFSSYHICCLGCFFWKQNTAHYRIRLSKTAHLSGNIHYYSLLCLICCHHLYTWSPLLSSLLLSLREYSIQLHQLLKC